MSTKLKPSIVSLENGQFLLKNVQGAWPDLREPKPFKDGDKPRYGITAFIPDDATDVLDFIKAKIDKIAADQLRIKKLPAADSCLKDGNAKDSETYHGHYQLALYSYPSEKLATKGKPQVVGRNGKDAIREDSSDYPVSGTYVNILFDLYTNTAYKKVSGGLKVVQRVADGPYIGSGVDLSALEDLGEEEIEDAASEEEFEA